MSGNSNGPPPSQSEVSGETNGTPKFVSRGGLKLLHAIREFGLDVRGRTCADFGCNVGGFTDCLLQHGAERVYALDTGYGSLAWTLRNDPRVVVRERTNALHAEPPEGGVDLVVIDMAWTPQRLCLPAAKRWLRASPASRIISLIKPHYEVADDERELLHRGVLDPAHAEPIAKRAFEQSAELGLCPLSLTRSPILGGRATKANRGNTEYLGLFAPEHAS